MKTKQKWIYWWNERIEWNQSMNAAFALAEWMNGAPRAANCPRQAIQQQYNFIRPRCAIEIDWIAEMEELPSLHPSTIKKLLNCWLDSGRGKKRNETNSSIPFIKENGMNGFTFLSLFLWIALLSSSINQHFFLCWWLMRWRKSWWVCFKEMEWSCLSSLCCPFTHQINKWIWWFQVVGYRFWPQQQEQQLSFHFFFN